MNDQRKSQLSKFEDAARELVREDDEQQLQDRLKVLLKKKLLADEIGRK